MALRKEVLRCFKSIHNARKTVFEEDTVALREARKKINEEFKMNKDVTDSKIIQELIDKSRSVETELRTCVIQAKEVKPGVYETKMRPETLKLENTPYNEELVNQKCREREQKKAANTKCCQE